MDTPEVLQRLDRIAAALEDLADERTKDRRWIASLSSEEMDWILSPELWKSRENRGMWKSREDRDA